MERDQTKKKRRRESKQSVSALYTVAGGAARPNGMQRVVGGERGIPLQLRDVSHIGIGRNVKKGSTHTSTNSPVHRSLEYHTKYDPPH